MQSGTTAALAAPILLALAGFATPLTERPAAAAEVNRPHVAPLEAAFLDASVVKRTFASRGARR